MIASALFSAVFMQTAAAQTLATTYSMTAQEDIGLEWLGRHSRRIAKLMAYLSVHQDASSACLCLNDAIRQVNRQCFDRTQFRSGDEDVVTVDTIVALKHLLEVDTDSEDRICMYLLDEINENAPSADGLHLQPLMDVISLG